jgi:hypothetical protein
MTSTVSSTMEEEREKEMKGEKEEQEEEEGKEEKKEIREGKGEEEEMMTSNSRMLVAVSTSLTAGEPFWQAR